MDSKELRGLAEAYSGVYSPEQIDEVSADLALKASKAADVKRGKLAAAGDKEGAAGKAAQASRLYKAQADRRLGRVTPGKANEELDIFDAILEYLVAEGYAATNKEALVIMANMSEEWRSEIVEAYVDYRKGKLPSGRTPQQAAQGREKLLNARAAAGSEKNVAKSPDIAPVTPGDVATSIRNRDRRERQSQRTQEMDSETGLAARVYKALPGAPRMKNEPNTERHYQAMQNRKIASNLRSAEKESRG